MSGRSRIDELDMGLTSASELQDYLTRARDLTRDLFMELEFAAEVLQQNLSTIPAVDSNGQKMGRIASRRRAKKVANCLRRAGESQKYCGGQVVKTWAIFVQSFAPEIEAERRKKPVKPGFRVTE